MPMSKTSMMGKRMEVALNVWINHNVTKQSSCNPVKRCTWGGDVIIPTNSVLTQLTQLMGKYITLDVGIARRKGKSGWYFFGIPKSNIRSNLNKKWQWGRAHTYFDLNRTFESHPAIWCPCIGRRHITPENAIAVAIKFVVGFVCLFCLTLLWTHRHGDLSKDGRHEGREADQNENDHVGHPELYFLNKKSPRWSQQHWSPKFTISSQTYLSY